MTVHAATMPETGYLPLEADEVLERLATIAGALTRIAAALDVLADESAARQRTAQQVDARRRERAARDYLCREDYIRRAQRDIAAGIYVSEQVRADLEIDRQANAHIEQTDPELIAQARAIAEQEAFDVAF